jgi:phosphatidate cytidylyltransferase
MLTRITVGTLIILVLAGLFWLDLYSRGYVACLTVMLVTAAALLELFRMADHAGHKTFRGVGVAFGVALIPYYTLVGVVIRAGRFPEPTEVACMLAPLLALVLAAMGRAATRREGLGPQLANIAVTVFAVLYVALPMAFLARIRFLTAPAPAGRAPQGWYLVILVLAVTKASDIGAYFAGTFLGRHKFAPTISPNKTIEGAIGGLLASIAVSVALACAIPIHLLTNVWAGPILFGVGVGIGSQLGDLTESLIKRSTGIKDSADILPSFGGVLDLIDSFLVAAPVAYFLLCLFIRLGPAAE